VCSKLESARGSDTDDDSEGRDHLVDDVWSIASHTRDWRVDKFGWTARSPPSLSHRRRQRCRVRGKGKLVSGKSFGAWKNAC
ncbi:hypothetical protein KI387_008634, partial [Taxus chinensis]